VSAITPPVDLTDGRLVLRLLHDDDVTAYAAAFRDDPELGRLLGVDQDPTEEFLHSRVARAQTRLAEGQIIELAIADAATDALRGSVIVHSFDWGNRRAEIGFFVVPAARGGGVCTSAVELVLGWLFADVELERVEMTTTPDNSAVPAIAARLGFAREGVMRSRNLERGERVDVVMFGLLRDEWRPRSAGT
jgi:RimJ/RimL family protein N-acetyltransferase